MESTRDHTVLATTTPSQVDNGERTMRIKLWAQHSARHAFVSRIAACVMLLSVAYASLGHLSDAQKLFWRSNLVYTYRHRTWLLMSTMAPATVTTSATATKTTTTTTTHEEGDSDDDAN